MEWLVVGSPALRYVSVAAIQELDLENTDLDSGYVKSVNHDAGLYLALDDSITEKA